MLRFIFAALLALFLSFFIVSCGGGGTGGPKPDRTIQFTANPNQTSSGSLENLTVTVEPQTFPDAQQVTITLHSQLNDPPQNTRFKADGAMLTVKTLAQPNRPLKATCQVDQSRPVRVVLIRTDNGWKGVPFQQNGAYLTFDLESGNQLRSQTGDFGAIWQAVVGWFNETVGNEPLGLTRIAGTGELGANSLILVHGIADTKDSMKKLADRLIQRNPTYSNAFGMGYDWKRPTPEAAQFLADRLNALTVVKSIDIVAHSRGVLVARYALEKLGATKPIRRFILLNGPNNGSAWAEPVEVGYGFIGWIAGSQNGNQQGTQLPSGNEPALVELGYNSAFTTALNQPNFQQRGNVDYYPVACLDDWVVPNDSALASNVPLETLTEGKIERLTVEGGHSSLLKDLSSIDGLIDKIFPLVERELTITADPNPNYAPGYSDGWTQTLTAVNNTGEPVRFYDHSIDRYDRAGAWAGRQWWLPNWSGYFPVEYQSFAITLGVGETYPMTTRTTAGGTPIANWDSRFQAQTGVYTIRARGLSSGRDYDARVAIVKYSDFGQPSAANTRAPRGNFRGPMQEGGNGKP